MIHRGELYTYNRERKPIFVVYGTAKHVAEALYMAYMYNRETQEYKDVGFSNINLLKYVFAKFKELFERSEEEVDLQADEERQELRKRRRERLQSRGARHLSVE